MGEAKRRQESRKDRLARTFKGCVYCGRTDGEFNHEHMPPRALFLKGERPGGLEFNCCVECNTGSKHSDLVAGYVTFGGAQPGTPEASKWQAHFDGISNNIPHLHDEMDPKNLQPERYLQALRLTSYSSEVSIKKTDGPIFLKLWRNFVGKLAFALHYDLEGQPVPPNGRAWVRWTTNAQLMEFPHLISVFREFSGMLGNAKLLKQGRLSTKGIFEYRSRSLEDGSGTVHAIHIRNTAVILAFANPSGLEDFNRGFLEIRPGFLRS